MSAEPVDRSWAEIHLGALQHNARIAHEFAGPDVELLAVIKANAYGHGIVRVAQTLASEAQSFGVANFEEALEVRSAVQSHPVLILGPALPNERHDIVANGFIATVSNADEASGFGPSAILNLEVDTGMGRMGCREEAAFETAKKIFAFPDVKLHSISTHLPSADEDEPFTRGQLARFINLVERIRAEAPGDYKVHALPSAGLLGFKESAFDMIRAGLILYGISPLPRLQHLLRPALSLKSRVVLLRDLPKGASISYGRTYTTPRPMRVATIGMGYADGFPRALSNRGAEVLIRGRRCAVLGRITMDLIVVDVSHLDDVELADEVVLIGKQGNEQILASEVAERAGTIPWEIFTGIGARVRRVYL